MAAQPYYSDAEKASVLATLASNGKNFSLTSHITGVPERTIRRWEAGIGVRAEVDELVGEKKASLADAWTEIQVKALGVTSGRLEDCTAAQACTIAAIAVDKAALLRGEPTEIADQRHTLTTDQAAVLAKMSPEQRDEYERLLARLAELQSGQIDPNLKPDEKLGLLLDGAGNPQRSEQSNDIPVEESKPTD